MRPEVQIGRVREGAQPKLTSSFCSKCGGFIGASTSPDILRIAEKAHECRTGRTAHLPPRPKT